MGPGKYGIFDTFADENGRNAHLNGEIAKALFGKAKELLAKAPDIAKPEILASKSNRSLILIFAFAPSHPAPVTSRWRAACVARDSHPINYEYPNSKDLTMLRKNRLFTPGPTPLLPAAQTAMAAFTAHHRTADFRALFTRVLADMKDFIGTKNDVLVLACSGTGVMEASVSNLTSPGDKVLVLTAGKFGERWQGLAKAFGCNVEVVSAPYGETISLDAVRAKLTPDVRVVYVQATESSTGARHDVKGLAKLRARRG